MPFYVYDNKVVLDIPEDQVDTVKATAAMRGKHIEPGVRFVANNGDYEFIIPESREDDFPLYMKSRWGKDVIKGEDYDKQESARKIQSADTLRAEKYGDNLNTSLDIVGGAKSAWRSASDKLRALVGRPPATPPPTSFARPGVTPPPAPANAAEPPAPGRASSSTKNLGTPPPFMRTGPMGELLPEMPANFGAGAAKTFGLEAVENAGPMATAVLGAQGGGAIGTAIMPGPGTAVGALLGALVGGVAGGIAQRKAQEAAVGKEFMQQTYDPMRAKMRKENPVAATAGIVAPQIIGFSPKSLGTIARELSAIRGVKAAEFATNPQAQKALAGIADSLVGAGFGAGAELAEQIKTGDYSGLRVAAQAAANAIYTDPRFKSNPQAKAVANELNDAVNRGFLEAIADDQAARQDVLNRGAPPVAEPGTVPRGTMTDAQRQILLQRQQAEPADPMTVVQETGRQGPRGREILQAQRRSAADELRAALMADKRTGEPVSVQQPAATPELTQARPEPPAATEAAPASSKTALPTPRQPIAAQKQPAVPVESKVDVFQATWQAIKAGQPVSDAAVRSNPTLFLAATRRGYVQQGENWILPGESKSTAKPAEAPAETAPAKPPQIERPPASQEGPPTAASGPAEPAPTGGTGMDVSTQPARPDVTPVNARQEKAKRGGWRPMTQKAREENPIAAMVEDNGGIRPYRRTQDDNRPYLKEHYESVPMRYRARKGGGGRAPDQMLEDVKRAGLLPTDATVEDLTAALRGAKRTMSEDQWWKAKQAEAEALEATTEIARPENLAVGDTYTEKGETFRVLEETDTALRVKDGREFWIRFDETDGVRIDKGSLRGADGKAKKIETITEAADDFNPPPAAEPAPAETNPLLAGTEGVRPKVRGETAVPQKENPLAELSGAKRAGEAERAQGESSVGQIITESNGSQYEVSGIRPDGSIRRRRIRTKKWTNNYGKTWNDGYTVGQDVTDAWNRLDYGFDVIAIEGKEAPGKRLVVDGIMGDNGVTLKWVSPQPSSGTTTGSNGKAKKIETITEAADDFNPPPVDSVPATASKGEKPPELMTPEEFDAFSESRYRAEMREQRAAADKVDSDNANRLRRMIAANPGDPANAGRQKTIAALEESIRGRSDMGEGDYVKPSDFMSPEQYAHHSGINDAIGASRPVSAAAVDAYGIKLPTDYVREGDRYVFKGESSSPTAPTTPPQKAATDTQAAQSPGATMSAETRPAGQPEAAKVRGAGVSVEDAYKSGMDVKTIAKTFGVDYTAVAKQLEKAGLISVSRPAAPSEPMTVAKYLDTTTSGVKLKLPTDGAGNKATHLRITDSQGRTSDVRLEDVQKGDNVLAGTGVVKVQAVRKVGKNETVLPGKVEMRAPPPPAGDIAARAKKRAQEGALNVAGAQKSLERVGRWIRQKFGRTHGLGKDLNEVVREWKARKAGASLSSSIVRNEFLRARDTLGKIHGRSVVNDALRDVVYGVKTPSDFAAQFGLPTTHPVVRTLAEFNRVRDANSATIATNLENAGAVSAAQAVRDTDYYVTRFYEAHILGDAFEPKPSDVLLAMRDLRDGLQDAVDRIAQRASAVQAAAHAVDIADYLNTGNPLALAGLTPAQAVEIANIGNGYFNLRQIIDHSVRSGDDVLIRLNAAALEDVATSQLNYYLGRTAEKSGTGGGIIDVSNLQRRYLQGVFRSLYGEVTDPAFAAAKTAETQSRIMVDQAFFSRVFTEGKDVWWSSLPSEQRGHTKQLPTDPKKYGNLSGKWISPELHDVIAPSARNPMLATFYYKPLATMRLLKLYGPRTLLRNYVTAQAGFALGSGDALRKTYMKNFTKAHALLARVVSGDPKALRELQALTDMDVFRTHGSSVMDSVKRLLDNTPTTKMDKAIDKLGRGYAFVDFPSKVAAYWTAKDRGLSDAAAAEHVRKYYQHPDSVPDFVRDMAKVPAFSDYPGYFFDSIRIAGNQVSNAIKSAASGDAVPLFGFMLSRVLSVLQTGGKAAKYAGLTAAWTAFHRRMRDDEGVNSVLMEEDEQIALRALLPSYYRHQPMIAWRERQQDGTYKIYYTITGNQSAWPAEDIIAGAMQADGGSVEEFIKQAGGGLRQQLLGPGMLAKTVYRTLTGDELAGTFESIGPLDTLGREVPGKARIWAESLGWGVADVVGGQASGRARQAAAIAAREKTGKEFEAGQYTPRQTYEDVLMGSIALVRTYELDQNELSRVVRKRVQDIAYGLDLSKRRIAQGIDVEYNQNARIAQMGKIAGLMGGVRAISTGVLEEDSIAAILTDAGLNKNEVKYAMGKTGFDGKPIPLSRYTPENRRTALEKTLR